MRAEEERRQRVVVALVEGVDEKGQDAIQRRRFVAAVFAYAHSIEKETVEGRSAANGIAIDARAVALGEEIVDFGLSTEYGGPVEKR